MEFKNLNEKIIEYLDGELPQFEEQELFSALASNEDLRNIMREHLAISRAIKADVDAFQPPANATFNILSSIGIPITAEGLQQNTIPKSYWTKTRKVGIPILLVILSSLLTFLVTYNFMKPIEPTSKVAKAIVQTPPVIIASSIDDGIENSTAKIANILVPKHNQNKPNANQLTISNYQDNVSTNQVLLNETKNSPSNTTTKYFADLNNPTQALPKQNWKLNNSKRFENSEQPRNVYFTFRGIVGKSFPNPNIPFANANKIFTNMSVGLYFTQWDNVKFGIELGNEVFGLSYLNVKDGIEYTYEQKPSIYWGAVSVDYNCPVQLSSIPTIHPFITALAGGTQIGGPILKGIAGLRFRPYGSNFEMYLGTEGTLLFYQNQKNYYLTRKISLTYGMSIIF